MGTLGTETTPSTWTQEAGLDAERGDELHHPLADADAGEDHALHGGHALAEHEEGHPGEGAGSCFLLGVGWAAADARSAASSSAAVGVSARGSDDMAPLRSAIDGIHKPYETVILVRDVGSVETDLNHTKQHSRFDGFNPRKPLRPKPTNVEKKRRRGNCSGTARLGRDETVPDFFPFFPVRRLVSPIFCFFLRPFLIARSYFLFFPPFGPVFFLTALKIK